MKEQEEALVSEEEFKRRLETFQVYNPAAVARYQSMGRAARRGHLQKDGSMTISRVHHNRKNTCKRKGKSSRAENDLQKKMWLHLKPMIQEAERKLKEELKNATNTNQ